ncbi:glutathione synthetase [Leptolyngbya sp. Heron Island J]|uniref:ATP-grasp domain-containing protein n=1 Tax=Leptolyngbya sp. Heron Island J TaxID=1385935 RepID=UPI0003B9CE9D|nr:glutathione synthetase [Leptolyngbya sp. Heron Island J]ESA38633.1 glutathione synthetase [Leptolyngbya sp. Heron Island J]
MKLLCITDPITHPDFDTTIGLYQLFAANPAIEFFHAPVSSIDGSSQFQSVPISGHLSKEAFFQLDRQPRIALPASELDLIFNRADEPVPADFFDHLSQLETTVRFVNQPSQVAYTRRKDFLESYGQAYLPDHIFSADYDEIEAFFQRFNPIVAKMNVSYGGKGVYKIWQVGDTVFTDNIQEGCLTYPSLRAAIAHLKHIDSSSDYEFVRFLKNIDVGDKRVLVVDGEIYGALLRKAKTDTWVHNITAGAAYYTAPVTERERMIIAETYDHYSRRGVYTLGYDFLMDDDGEWILSEVNAGNIGGYDWLEEITGDPILERLTQRLFQLAKQSIRALNS